MQNLTLQENLRATIFVITFILLLVGLEPFKGNDSAILLFAESGRDAFIYFLILVSGTWSVYILWESEKEALKLVFTPIFMILMVWLIVSVGLSTDKFGSLKRLFLFIVCLNLYISIFLLPKNRDQMANLLGGTSLIIIIVSFLGLIIVPHLTIHQATDAIEPHLAGGWRGVWGHKNTAGPIMASFIFIAIFLLLIKKYALGSLLLVLSVIFFLFTGAKTALMSCVMTLVTVIPAIYIDNTSLRVFLIFLPVVLLNVLGAGATVFPLLQPLVNTLPIDPTFTGRDRAWRYLLENIDKNIWFGRGYSSFWDSEQVKNARIENATEGAWALHGHQSLLDLSVNIGILGAFLFILWGFYQPMKDLNDALKRGHDKATLLLLALLWQFWMLNASMESFFLERLLSSWFMFTFAVFGLRYLSKFNIDTGLK